MKNAEQQLLLLGKRLQLRLEAIGQSLQNIDRHLAKIIESAEVKEAAAKEKAREPLPIQVHAPIPEVPEESNRKQRSGRRDKWRLRLDLAVVVATISLGVLAFLQWRQMTIATEASKKSADAAERAAKSAEVATAQASENERRDQRAWVGIQQMFLGGLAEDRNGQFSVYYELR